MGGLPCAKEVIDNRNRLRQQLATQMAAADRVLDCMTASILLNADQTQPTYEDAERFHFAVDVVATNLKEALDPLLKLAGAIEAHVRGGNGSPG